MITLYMFQNGKHHAVFDCIYARVPGVLVEIFAGTKFCDFSKSQKIANIVPANKSNNKVVRYDRFSPIEER